MRFNMTKFACAALGLVALADTARADDGTWDSNATGLAAGSLGNCGCRGLSDAAYLRTDSHWGEEVRPVCAVRYSDGQFLLRFSAAKPIPVILTVTEMKEAPVAYTVTPDGDGMVAVSLHSAGSWLRLRSGDAVADLF